MTYSTCEFDFYVYARTTESDPWSYFGMNRVPRMALPIGPPPSIGLSLQMRVRSYSEVVGFAMDLLIIIHIRVI